MYGKRAIFEDQRSATRAQINSASPDYHRVEDAFDHPVRMLMVLNDTDVALQFLLAKSDEPVDTDTKSFVLLAQSHVIFDFGSNAVDVGGSFFFGKGDAVFVQELGVPTTGNVYVSVIYGKGD